MAVAARIRTVKTRDIVLEHLRAAENCHQDPEELSEFIDQLYDAAGVDPRWALVEVDVGDMVRFFDRCGAFEDIAVRDNRTVEQYKKKLERKLPPPGAVTTAQAGGLSVIDGRHRLLALRRAGHDRSRWYVPEGNLRELQALLRALPSDEPTEPHAATTSPASPA